MDSWVHTHFITNLDHLLQTIHFPEDKKHMHTPIYLKVQNSVIRLKNRRFKNYTFGDTSPILHSYICTIFRRYTLTPINNDAISSHNNYTEYKSIILYYIVFQIYLTYTMTFILFNFFTFSVFK